MKKQVKIEDLEFIRSLKAYDKDGNLVTSFITQPYCVGMYIIIDNNSSLQWGQDYKHFNKWVKGSIKKMENNGYRLEINKSNYINFLSEQEIKDYVLK